MDLLSRITSPNKQSWKLRLSDPKARFELTKEACSDVKNEKIDNESLEKTINTLTSVLKEEQKLASNEQIDVCAKWFLKEGGLNAVAKNIKNVPGWLYLNIFALFRTLFDSDHEMIIRDKELIQSTTIFLQNMTNLNLDRPQEEDFAQLLFIMVSKIKANPEVVKEWLKVVENSNNSRSYQDEFPLFYLLLDYVYHDGNVGEYARTGLLYLVDLISISKDIETWVLESDLCTLIASGLGALYSQLNRGVWKLESLCSELPAVVSLSHDTDPAVANQKAKNDSKKYKVHVENFISYLQFWQDMINYCQSEKLKERLLAHFDVLFVRQLLYPSIVQSTDNEGSNYSVPTLTVFRHILEILDHNELSDTILKYFTGHSEQRQPAKVNSTDNQLLTDDNDDVLLTLRDVILSCLVSEKEKLQLVGLQLLSVLIRKFYPYILGTVITAAHTTTTGKSDEQQKNVSESLCIKELSILQQIKQDIESQDHGSIQAYESDIEIRISNFPFPLPNQLKALLPEERLRRRDLPINKNLYMHAVRPDDNLLTKCYQMLLDFFSNSTEINIALTGVFIDLGTCGWCTLRSWLLVYDFDLLNEQQTNLLTNTKVLQILQDLANQYQHYSLTIENFDTSMQDFERGLKLSEEINDAMESNEHNDHEQHENEHHEDEQSQPIVTTPVRRVTRSLSRLSLPKLRSPHSTTTTRDSYSPKVKTALSLSRTSSTSTLNTSSSYLENKVRLVQPSAETRRSISTCLSENYQQPERVPSELDIDKRQQSVVRLAQVFSNIIVLREFVKEVEALIHIRSWLVD